MSLAQGSKTDRVLKDRLLLREVDLIDERPKKEARKSVKDIFEIKKPSRK